MRRIYSSEVSRTIRFAMEGERNRILPSNIECAVASTYIVAEQCCSCQHDILSSSSSLMACPYWSVAVSIRWRHKMRSSAFLQAEWMPMLNVWTSASIPLCQVERERPRGLLQPWGGLSEALIALWWSCLGSARATYPKKRRRPRRIDTETGGQPVVSLTTALVTTYYPLLILWIVEP